MPVAALGSAFGPSVEGVVALACRSIGVGRRGERGTVAVAVRRSDTVLGVAAGSLGSLRVGREPAGRR